MRSRVLALAVVLSLSSPGCVVGPDFVRPAVSTPDAWVQPTAEGATIADRGWWELFDDPVLDELIRVALDENRDLRAAWWRTEEALARLGLTRAESWPSFSYNAGASTFDPSEEVPPGTGQRVDDWLAAVGVSWEIDLFGRLRRSTEAAQAELLATEEARRAVAIALVAAVATTYFALLGYDDQLEIARRTLDSRRASLDLIRSRYEGGIVPQLDVHQAEIEEAAAAAAVPALERAVARTENALRVLLGRPPGPIPRGNRLPSHGLAPEVPAGLPAELLRRRPDVLEAEHVAHAQLARVGVAQALRYPSLRLTGAAGLESDDVGEWISSSAAFWSVGANLFGPIFEFGKNKRRVEVERARAEQAVLAYERTVLEAFREVEDALIAQRTLRDEFGARERQTASAHAAVRLSRARYDAGFTSYLEVLDLERSLFAAELETASTRAATFEALIRLYKALGGGWVESDVWAGPGDSAGTTE